MLKFRGNVKSKEIELPMGITLKDGTTYTKCTVEAMDGNDEENISERKIQNNGAKIVTRLLGQKIKKVGDVEFPHGIGESLARKMFSDDRDTCLIEIRGLMKDEMEVSPQCNRCGSVNDTVILMSDIIKANRKWGDDEELHDPGLDLGVVEFELPDGIIMIDDETNKDVVCKKGKLRLPDGVIEEGITANNQNNAGKANTLLLASCIIELENIRRVDQYVVKAMTRVDREYLSNIIESAKPGPKMYVEKECENCGNTYKYMLQLPYFFTTGTNQ